MVSEELTDETLTVLLDTLKLVQQSPVDDIPRHLTMVLAETWLAYSRVAPERYSIYIVVYVSNLQVNYCIADIFYIRFVIRTSMRWFNHLFISESKI